MTTTTTTTKTALICAYDRAVKTGHELTATLYWLADQDAKTVAKFLCNNPVIAKAIMEV